MFDVLPIQPGTALGGFSDEAPQTNVKLQDFTVGLKIYDEASGTAIDGKLQWSKVKDVSFSDIERPICICISVLTVSQTVKIMDELCIYFVSKGPLNEKYHNTIIFSSNILVHCSNDHFWPHLYWLSVLD